MNDSWTRRWDERYQDPEYAYGLEPNEYLKKQLDLLKPGKILFGAEGEGRNGVYAAKLGWEVYAFDISEEGRKKAIQLADRNQVSIEYRVGELPQLDFQKDGFEAVVLIYAHFPPEIRSEYHQLLIQNLKQGGHIIFEAFSKRNLEYRQINPKIGGPPDIESLFSLEEIKSDFPDFEILELAEVVIELHEGLYHNGTGCVIRFVGRRK